MSAVPSEEGPQPGPFLKLFRDRRVAFLVVGGFNTAVGFGLFISIDLLLGPAIDAAFQPVIASLIVLMMSHVAAVLIAFVLYRRLVFRVQGNVLRDLLRFETVYLFAISINAISLPLLVQLGMNRIWAQGLILLVTTTVSYVGHSRFSFFRPAPGHAADQPDLTS